MGFSGFFLPHTVSLHLPLQFFPACTSVHQAVGPPELLPLSDLSGLAGQEMVLWKAQGSDSDPPGEVLLLRRCWKGMVMLMRVNEDSVTGKEFVIPIDV